MDLGTGLFVLSKTDLFLPDILPIALTRTYRQGDAESRPFGRGATHPYEMFLWSAQQYQEADLILPDGGRVHYVRISPGSGFGDAVFEHTATPSVFYKSRITWNGNGWDLTLRDGTVYVFGENAPLQSIRDRFGNKIVLTRTSGQSGNITKLTSPNGRWVEFKYDTSNRIIEAKDNSGRGVTYAYDTNGRLAKVTDPNEGVTEYTYDASHRMFTIKDARKIIFLTNTYDANGRVAIQTQADGSTYQAIYTLDSDGKIVQTDVTDPRGNVRRVTFNASGYTLTDTLAVGKPDEEQKTIYEREAGTNLMLSVTDPLGRKTAYSYDSMGNVTSITRLAGTPEAVTTSFTYEPRFNQVASITNPLSHTTGFTYDTKGNLITVTDPLGNQTTLIYNAAGQPLSITNPVGNPTGFTYAGGDLIAVADPLGNTTTRSPDSVGRLVGLTNPLGHATQYDYDPLNRLKKVTDALQGVTGFAYDPNGNLLSVTDARGSVTGYTYNNMDRLETREDPLLRGESYVYDANGNLKQFTDRKGQVTTFEEYDALDRRTKATYADGSTTTYTYDKGNRLTRVVDSLSGTITLAYDDLDRLIEESTPQGKGSYIYDKAGRRRSMTVAGQATVNYDYDAANRLTQITQGTSAVTVAYNAAGRRTALTLPNSVVVRYAYDPASRVTGITYKLGTTVLGNLTYEYDRAGNRIKIGGSWARIGLPQAIAAASYDAANQQLALGDKTMTYDKNGNLESLIEPSSTTTFTWDPRNRLAGLTGPSLIASFVYDGLGRRTTKVVNGASTTFRYDGVNPVQELAGTTADANILTGLGVDEYLTRTDAPGPRTVLTDALGSTSQEVLMLVVEDLKRLSWHCIHFVPEHESPIVHEKLKNVELEILEVQGDQIETEQQLLSALAKAMLFPDYFGMNWDALEECMRDMDWLPSKGYVLFFHNAEQFWRRANRIAGALVESWLFAAEEWGHNGIPFHLVFLW